jgi:Zn finger protein HypA/HybF involved in hydrogenase expression
MCSSYGSFQATFQRILISAREKVADSLINGKGICIEGGNFTRNICRVKCSDCGRESTESYEEYENLKNGQYRCPECGSANVACVSQGNFCNKHCRRRGQDF